MKRPRTTTERDRFRAARLIEAQDAERAARRQRRALARLRRRPPTDSVWVKAARRTSIIIHTFAVAYFEGRAAALRKGVR